MNTRVINRGNASSKMINLAKKAAQSVADEADAFVEVKIINRTIVLVVYDEKI